VEFGVRVKKRTLQGRPTETARSRDPEAGSGLIAAFRRRTRPGPSQERPPTTSGGTTRSARAPGESTEEKQLWQQHRLNFLVAGALLVCAVLYRGSGYWRCRGTRNSPLMPWQTEQATGAENWDDASGIPGAFTAA